MLHKHSAALDHVVEAYTHDVEQLVPIHPEFVATVLDEEAADDAVFTADTGMCCSWIARYITPNGRRKLIGSWVHGTMANALPHAIGAQMVDRGRQVVSMSGDGGLEMLVDGDPPFETDHDSVDFAAIARAAGFHAIRVEKPDELRPAMRAMLDCDGPALLDVVTDPDALEIPPHITKEEAAGFALSVGRTVLAGGVGSMLHVARSNDVWDVLLIAADETRTLSQLIRL